MCSNTKTILNNSGPDSQESILSHLYYVGGDKPENSYLICGTKNFLFDTGMAWCGAQTVQQVKERLKGKELDCIFLTHSHYDHISGLPDLRREWPNVTVLIAPHGKAVLEKESARRVMRKMNEAAARTQGLPAPIYDEQSFRAERTLEDGQTVDLNEWHVTAVAAPGHTRDCLSYQIRRDGCRETMMLCCETAGVYVDNVGFTPCFLVGFEESLGSIGKMEQAGADILIGSHYGILDPEKIPDIWGQCIRDTKRAGKRMLEVMAQTDDVDEQIRYLAKDYWPEKIHAYQPYEAYAENMKHMLATIRREKKPA